jgi:hypothetical protein
MQGKRNSVLANKVKILEVQTNAETLKIIQMSCISALDSAAAQRCNDTAISATQHKRYMPELFTEIATVLNATSTVLAHKSCWHTLVRGFREKKHLDARSLL